jgi:AcrR family transcriptional regulator
VATNSGPLTGPAGPAGPVDRRVRRTRQAIQRALVELTLEKGYDQVTVSDLIRRADVGRLTFYAHFDGKQAVLQAGLGELTFLHAVPRADGPLFAFTRMMFEHVRDQRDLVRALLGRRSGRAVMAHGEQVLRAAVRDELLARGVRASTSLDLVVTGVVGALMALLTTWVDGEISATPAELDAAFRATVVPGMRALL